MNAADVIAALALPPETRVDQRVPKKLLVEHGAPTAADKRQIQDGIEALHWLAALKPATVGVPEYRDGLRDVVEIAVLSLSLRPPAKGPRLTELVHRAVPYPLLLLTAQADTLTLSLAGKRFSQNEAGRVVLDGAVTVCPLAAHPAAPAFLDRLALPAQPRTHLLALYQGWTACLEAFQAAQLTGQFTLAPSAASVAARREALAAHDRITREIAHVRAQAEKASQVNRRVELNLKLQRLNAELAQTIANL